jgi:hypothetical protein
MRAFVKGIVFAGLAVFTAAPASALTVVDVAAPATNCTWNVTCTVTVSDSVGDFTPPGDTAGARLQSRTYPGNPPAAAAGDMAYVYRVDMTGAKGITAVNCVTALTLTFGPVVPLPYVKGKMGTSDVFVVTQGGLGSVGLSSATQSGATIKFTFAAPVCPGATSYFFGLGSKTTMPKPGKAQLSYSLGGSGTTDDRAP